MISTIRSQFTGQKNVAPSGKVFKMLGVTLIGMAGLILANSYAQAADDGLTHRDKKFLISAAEAGNAEISASKIALEKSSDPAVKDFAQKMIADHTKVGDDLKKLAASKNVTVPDQPSLAQRAKIDILSKRSGTSFNKHYASVIGVSAHKDAVALFEKEAANAKDADIKQFAANNLPALQGHLQMALTLKTTVDVEK
jgi:putative membrane protein